MSKQTICIYQYSPVCAGPVQTPKLLVFSRTCLYNYVSFMLHLERYVSFVLYLERKNNYEQGHIILREE